MSKTPIRTPEPISAPSCPLWCEAVGGCRWQPLTERGARDFGVPIGTWICDHLAGDVARIFTYGREFSHKPGHITPAALLDDVDLVEDITMARSGELRDAAQRLQEVAARLEEINA